MKVDLTKVLEILDDKFSLAQKRENYDIMTLIVDVKKKILHQAELEN